ncbi:MBL fold metallo-hydrolase [Halorubrum vacuolatum]|uniref:Thiosulfate/3-mercaptopyruvate sulfurtransferase n=1 Tax=Halorubrum vacuolatum TaxID=63740 RepID=A0A238W8N7_HALVU|nr:rhodanese-like domain-containing protein [Halorubrum vacuolatum]SNR42654.1 thiosulfate/3-mercaptopyruvate sulfurtransferase [Halorubrum vacuolatum]
MSTEIDAETLRDMLDERRRGDRSFVVVDTRPEESFEGWRIADSVNYFYKPFHEFDLDDFEAQTGVTSDDDVVTLCAKGKASTAFADELESAGYRDVHVVEEGMRAWSAVYDHVPVPLPEAGDEPLDIVQIQRRAKGCLGYLIVGGTAGDSGDTPHTEESEGGDRVAVAVDVSRHGTEWIGAAEAYDARIVGVLDTHVHADHLSGGRALADDLDVPYYLPAAAAGRDVAYEFEPIERNTTLDVGGVDLKAIATPGHTEDMASYLIGRSAVLTGDTLFADGIGRTELQFAAGGGDEDDADAESDDNAERTGAVGGAHDLYDSLHATLLAEPDDIVVCPGHFPVSNDGTTGSAVPGEPVTTTVGAARTDLDVLGLDREAFVERITDTLPEKPPNYTAVIAANRGVEQPPDPISAIELELGPNRCAAEATAEPRADD